MKYNKNYIFIFLGLVYFFCNQPSVLYAQEVNHAHIDSVLSVIKYQNKIDKAISNEDLGFQIIRKHAQASSILIQFIGHEDDLSMFVEDHELGFNYIEQLATGGLGLKSINSRVQFPDGSINWDTKPGNGTTINVTIPVK